MDKNTVYITYNTGKQCHSCLHNNETLDGGCAEYCVNNFYSIGEEPNCYKEKIICQK